jgi:predicted phosphoadenosine phosphosulfate sulfurtransferase
MPRLGKKKIIDQNVHELALERIRRAYDLFDTVAVMFSGGKDSTACLNLVLEVAKERGIKKVPVHHFDEEAIPYETEHYVRRVANLPGVDFHWWCLPVRHRNACSVKEPWWFPWAPEDKAKWVRPLPPEAITFVEGYPKDPKQRLTIPEINGYLFNPTKHGNVGIVMGIRADESLTRTRAILNSRNREDKHIIKYDEGTSQGNIYKVYPVYDWSTKDIWTAPKKFGWDYNTAYDLMDKMGIRPNDQRCAPPYGEEPMRGLYQFRELFPDIWGKMQTRVDGAATAARYSNTVLYSFGKNPEKPENMTWHEFIKFWVNKHPEPYRSQVADRIRGFIHNHYNKTKEPIMHKAAHPRTGVSWDFLLKIAVRGDFKGRKQPNIQGGVDEALKAKRKYDEARFRSATHK